MRSGEKDLRSWYSAKPESTCSVYPARAIALKPTCPRRSWPYAELNGLTGRAKLNQWLYTLPDLAPSAAITSVSSSRSPKAVGRPNPYTGIALHADTKSAGRSFVPVMAQSAVDRIPPGPKLDALTAEKVFGWKNVHKHEGTLVGKKQDKAGRWRSAKVPNYSTNPLHSYSVENRMKQLERLDRYQKELAKITRSKNIPSDWASPDQRCRAAINAVGQYRRVIPSRKSGGE